MNNRRVTLNAKFGPETRFANPPGTDTSFRATLEHELEELKARLLREALAGAEPALAASLHRAASDAMALVWLLPHPLLLLPELFREKARSAIEQTRRQQRIHASTRRLIANAA